MADPSLLPSGRPDDRIVAGTRSSVGKAAIMVIFAWPASFCRIATGAGPTDGRLLPDLARQAAQVLGARPDIQQLTPGGLGFVEAGLTCLAKGGITAFTVDNICREAKASRGLIAHHFGSKDALLAAVYATMYDRLIAVMAPVDASAPSVVALIEAVPYKIHTVLTDNGIQFRYPPRYANGPTARYMTHMFAMRCRENDIEHRFTKINHPWTNGQVERMNRTIKDATVKRFHYDSHEQLRLHLQNFSDAYNFGRRLKTLRGLTPYEFICKRWTSEPDRFITNPFHQMPGLNN